MSDEIQDESAKKILYRLDERTERIDDEIERMNDRTTRLEGRVSAVETRTDENGEQIQRNSTILNAITLGLGSVLTAAIAKIQGLIHF